MSTIKILDIVAINSDLKKKKYYYKVNWNKTEKKKNENRNNVYKVNCLNKAHCINFAAKRRVSVAPPSAKLLNFVYS